MSIRERRYVKVSSVLKKCGWANPHAIAQDIEMQQPHTSFHNATPEEHHMIAVQSLFGLSRRELDRWPGMTAYCKFLEKQFQPLIADEYSHLWTAIGMNRPQNVGGCWPWFNSVTSTIRSMVDEDSSIEDVWCDLRTPLSGPNTTRPDTAGFIAVFSVLCWCTMVLQPKLGGDRNESGSTPSLTVHQQHSDQPGLKMDTVFRPIPAIFRQFRKTMITSQWRQPIGSHGSAEQVSTALYVSSLNYASLKMISKVQLVWTDNLTSHLDFDPTNRQLSVFKFPSYCAISALKCRDMPRIYAW